ncbi:hypothetical protein AVEN_228110-1 [Araneus ventricosus]|uniref:Uncharacterized protein n=1 Tax=Araneus ventricosus TaxID=182803 RepID=A0A4Y2HRK1_ARAVE|nr:hypothetical protein AVEN_228110-1 [Araneus ventricosus]
MIGAWNIYPPIHPLLRHWTLKSSGAHWQFEIPSKPMIGVKSSVVKQATTHYHKISVAHVMPCLHHFEPFSRLEPQPLQLSDIQSKPSCGRHRRFEELVSPTFLWRVASSETRCGSQRLRQLRLLKSMLSQRRWSSHEIDSIHLLDHLAPISELQKPPQGELHCCHLSRTNSCQWSLLSKCYG